MVEAETLNQKPILYAGQPLPLHALSSDAFQSFVFAALIACGKHFDFRVVGKPAGSGDGGFDVDALRLADSAQVGIQCKRYQDPISIPEIAVELAKIAMTAAVQKSKVKEQYIITTGKVRTKAKHALREINRETLKSAASAVAVDNDDLEGLRQQVAALGLSAEAIANEHVSSLEKLVVWSGDEFDSALGCVWTEIQDVVARYFVVQTQLREHPRPDFDAAAYLTRHHAQAAEFVEPFVRPTSLPPGLRRQSAGLVARGPISRRPKEVRVENVSDLLGAVEGITLLVGPGGAGKTTAMQWLQAAALKHWKDEADSPIPVFVRLAHAQTTLGDAIKRALGITAGSWLSIPGRFLLLLDGLNELGPDVVDATMAEIDYLIGAGRVTALVSVRGGGVRDPLVLPALGEAYELLPFGPVLALALVNRLVTREVYQAFATEFLAIRTRPEYLMRPFALAIAAEVYGVERVFPRSLAGLLERVVSRRLERDRELARTLPPAARGIPKQTVRVLAQNVAYEMRIIRSRTTVPAAVAGTLIASALAATTASGALGADALSSSDAVAVLRHFEILRMDDEETLSFEHDLVADYLASRPLVDRWASAQRSLASAVADDAWLLAAGLISDDDKTRFLKLLADVDLVLMARAASEAGPRLVETAEGILLTRDEHASGDVATWGCATALGVLGTVAAVRRLKARAASGGTRGFQAMRGLALAGDVHFLEAILPDVDRSSSGPAKVSGGMMDVWPLAPLGPAVDAARKRVGEAGPGALLAESLSLLGAFGEISDVPLIARSVENAGSLQTAQAALFALHRLDPKAAISKAQEMFIASGPVGKVRVSGILHSLGLPLDLDWLLNVCLDGVIFQADAAPEPDGWAMIQTEAEDLLANSEPTSVLRERIFEEFNKRPPGERSLLWRLAAAYDMHEFDAAITTALDAGLRHDFGSAASAVDKRGAPIPVTRAWLDQIDATLRAHPSLLLEWDGRRGLGVLAAHNYHRQQVADLGFGALQQLLPALREAQNGSVPALAHALPWFRVNMEARTTALCLERDIAGLLSPLASVAELLPTSPILLDLLDAGASVWDETTILAAVEVLRGFAQEELDERAARVDRHPIARAAALLMVGNLGPTPKRIEMVGELFARSMNHIAALTKVMKAVEAIWGRDVARVVVEQIAQRQDWTGFRADLFEETRSWMGRGLTPAWVDDFVRPYLATELHPTARAILEFWLEFVAQRRDS